MIEHTEFQPLLEKLEQALTHEALIREEYTNQKNLLAYEEALVALNTRTLAVKEGIKLNESTIEASVRTNRQVLAYEDNVRHTQRLLDEAHNQVEIARTRIRIEQLLVEHSIAAMQYRDNTVLLRTRTKP